MVTIKRSSDNSLFSVKATNFSKADQEYFLAKGRQLSKPAAAPPAKVVLSPSNSYLPRIFGLRWEMTKSQMLDKFAKEPDIRRQKGNRHGYAHFQGGKFFDKPVGGSYLLFYDERLTWMDTNFPAPGDSLVLFQELAKKLDVLLGPTDLVQTDRNGGRLKRTRIWKTTSGAPAEREKPSS